MRARLILLYAVLLSAWFIPPLYAEQKAANSDYRYYLSVPEGKLPEFFTWSPFRRPLISHHRGGPKPGYPENAIETMEEALKFGPGLMEVDIAQLKDGTLVLMHDNTVDRTTTGTGHISNLDWPYIKSLSLKDNEGEVTEFKVPLLKDALEWTKGKAILTLDIKRGTSFKNIVEEVKAAHANDYVVAISYTLKQAIAYHQIAPWMPITVSINSEDDIAAVKASGIPSHLIIAWTGLERKSPEFYQKLHKEGWSVVMGTLGRPETALDFKFEREGNDKAYLDIYKSGVDIIATDRYWAIQPLIQTPDLFFFVRQQANY